jgi:hypothetical protein
MTFLEIQRRICRRTGKNATSIDTATATRLKDFINEAHKDVLRKPGREQLRYASLTFASVASQKLYALPLQGVARINRITEATNDRRLVYQTPDWLDTVAPDPTAGTPCYWIPRGYSEVHTQPSNASAVFVDSTSASDTGVAYVEGIRTGGFYASVNVSMTGTTAVQVGTVTDFEQITRFYLGTAAVGTVTLHEDASGGTELSKIAASSQVSQTHARYQTFQLYPTPSGVLTYTADILRGVVDMTESTDEPLLPMDFHEVLIDLALMKEMSKADDARRWEAAADSAKRGLRDLDTFLTAHPDWRPTWGGPVMEQPAFAGGWFPAH